MQKKIYVEPTLEKREELVRITEAPPMIISGPTD